MISEDPSNLGGNPDLVPLLAILQERDDFNVDSENDMIKPVNEDNFLEETLKNLVNLSSQHPEIKIDQCKEGLGNVKDQLLESVKKRWIRPGRRNSMSSSNISGGSKRDRDGKSPDRDHSRLRTNSPVHQ